MKPWLVIAAVAIGLFRPVLLVRDFNQHIEASYQAAAHILVTWLYASWWFTGESKALNGFLILTAIEVICAAAAVAMKLGVL